MEFTRRKEQISCETERSFPIHALHITAGASLRPYGLSRDFALLLQFFGRHKRALAVARRLHDLGELSILAQRGQQRV